MVNSWALPAIPGSFWAGPVPQLSRGSADFSEVPLPRRPMKAVAGQVWSLARAEDQSQVGNAAAAPLRAPPASAPPFSLRWPLSSPGASSHCLLRKWALIWGVPPAPLILKLRFSAAPEGCFLWSLRSVQVRMEAFRMGTLTPSHPFSWPLTGEQCGQTPQS